MTANLRALLAGATKGPWYLLESPWLDSDLETMVLAGSPDPHAGKFVCDFEDCDTLDEEEKNHWNNAALIVAAVNALPDLLDRLERAEADAARARQDAERRKTLRAVLRGLCIESYPVGATDVVEKCMLCDHEWRNEPERHAPDCLAAEGQ